jgi:hypothetical protein
MRGFYGETDGGNYQNVHIGENVHTLWDDSREKKKVASIFKFQKPFLQLKRMKR